MIPLASHWLDGQTLVWFDTQVLYAPQRALIDEALRAFRLPLWNPYLGTGTPLLAEGIHGVLHPVSVAVAWLGTPRSADLLIGGYLLSASIGGAVLARTLGVSRTAAVVAALTYSLSGFVLSMVGNLVFLAGAGSLPWCLAGLLRTAAGRAPLGIAAGVLGTAVLALSGDAQTLMLTGPLAFALAWSVGRWRGAVRATAAGVIGLLVSGVHLLPVAVHVSRTVRSEPLTQGVEEHWALEATRLPELVLSGLFHNRDDPRLDPVYAAVVEPERRPADAAALPFAASIFVGIIPLALACAGARRNRMGWFLAGAALTFAWVGFGTTLGAHEVLRHVPVWAHFRYMEKLAGPLTLLIALLAAFGADAASADRRTARGTAVCAALMLVAALLATAALRARLGADGVQLLEARMGRVAWHAAACVGVVAVWAHLHGRMGSNWRLLPIALASWLASVAASPAALRPGSPSARLEAAGPLLAAPPPGARAVTPYGYSPGGDSGEDTLDREGRVLTALAAPAYNVRNRIDNVGDRTGLSSLRLSILRTMLGDRWVYAARRFGVTHVLIQPPTTSSEATLHALSTQSALLLPPTAPGLETWATPHRPWASFPPGLRVVGDDSTGILETISAVGGDDPSVVVQAETKPPIAYGHSVSIPTEVQALDSSLARLSVTPGIIHGVDRHTDWVRIDAEAHSPGVLVVLDAWWPGWEATIDDKEVPILVADALVRAIPWPEGRHVLAMHYRPQEVRQGTILTAIGLLAALAWAAVAHGKVRRTETHTSPAEPYPSSPASSPPPSAPAPASPSPSPANPTP